MTSLYLQLYNPELEKKEKERKQTNKNIAKYFVCLLKNNRYKKQNIF